MAFLYSSYIIINAVMSSVLGSVIDNDFTQNKNIIYSLKTVGGYVYLFSIVLICQTDVIFQCSLLCCLSHNLHIDLHSEGLLLLQP